MSVNFSLDSVYWNTTQNCGMREIFRSKDRFPLTLTACSGPEYEARYRPENIPLWRDNLKILFSDSEDCLTMWMSAMDEFEEDPTLYFTVTY